MKSKSTQILPFFILFSLIVSLKVTAKEGMWLAKQIKRQEQDMKRLGLNISAKQLFNESQTGLNNAVIIFDKGCTAEVVSQKGLIFTNHHCGYSKVQEISTSQHNYLIDGYWAKSSKEEIPCPGLTVSFIRKTEEVTSDILKNVSDSLPEVERQRLIRENIDNLTKAYTKMTAFSAEIKPFYNGNQYWLFLTETFSDVRLVGFPPNGIGKYGGDTDNWMWPRTTGDFSIFRIYANKNNQPASYNVNNVPYKTPTFLKINAKGVKEGDFSMVYGFPFQTQEYISSYQLEQIQRIVDPIRISSRKARLGAWDKQMRANPDVFLKYAAKQSSVSNGYKKWQGEVLGLEVNAVTNKKSRYEDKIQFTAFQSNNATDKLVLPELQTVISNGNPFVKANIYASETVLAIEAIQQAKYLQKMLAIYRSKLSQSKIVDTFSVLKKELDKFYKNYELATDQDVFKVLMPLYMNADNTLAAPGLKKIKYNNGDNFDTWSNALYKNSLITQKENLFNLLDDPKISDSNLIKEDPAFVIYNEINNWQNNSISPKLLNYSSRLNEMNRKFTRLQLNFRKNGEGDFYPDANQTQRITYGKVQGIATEGKGYQFQTFLEDAVAKFNPEVEEFNMPLKLRQLFEKKDYGKWSIGKKVPVNFLASNHTSGGNSGSPVLDKNGNLVGVNFDRIFQGTMSDLYYDPNRCRNVVLDIRYLLFIVEKFGEAKWLFKELKFVP